jgi:hypothetical protein
VPQVKVEGLRSVFVALARNRTTNLNVDADTAVATAKIARLTGLRHRITVDADTGAAMVKIAGLGVAAHAANGQVGGLSHGLLIATAVAALAAPAVGLVSTAILGIPGAVAVAGVAIAAIALGMDGIKRVADVAGPSLDRLKAAVSSTFQAGLTPVFQQIANVLLPGITAGMQSVAGGVVSLAAAFVGVVTSARGMELINQVLANTAAFLTGIGGFVQGVTSGFLTLAAVGSAALTRFAGVLNAFGRRVRSVSAISCGSPRRSTTPPTDGISTASNTPL